MAALMATARARGITHVAYGDLWLEDVRAYRVTTHEGTGITPIFPIWLGGHDGEAGARERSRELAACMVAAGLSAVLLTVDTKQLPAHFCGRRFDAALLADLPPGVDAMGEKGEFHSLATAGGC